MKKLTCLIAILSVVALMGAKQLPCCKMDKAQCDAIEKAVLKTHDQMITAAEKLDAETMFSFILENDKGAIAQNGTIMTRQQALDMVRQAFSGADTLKYDFKQRNIKMLSPTTALMISAGATTSTMSGQTFTSDFANTTVFVLQDNQWKVIHGHHSTPNFD